MKVLLDTNICIYIIKQKPPQVLAHFQLYMPGDVGVSAITVAELEYGVQKSQHIEKNKLALQQFFLPLSIVAFDTQAAMAYGEIRAALEKRGTPIGALDLLIAAQALALDLVLATNNTKEFERVEGLHLENWAE